MKKYLIIAAVALVASAACTKVETDETPAKKISFQIASYSTQTRAAEDPVELTETTSFSSKAWLHANGTTGTDFFGTSSNNWTETISRNPSTESSSYTWEPSLEYFWPKASNSYINFISWFATNSKNPTIPDETHMNWGTAESPLIIASNDNFLFADEAWRFNDNRTSTYSNKVSEGVPTLFHHALAKVQFDIQLATDQTPTTKTVWDVVVTSASLTIGKKGYLPLVNSDPSSSNTTRAWSVGTTYSSEAANAATSANVGWTAVSTGENATETISSFETPTLTLAPKDASSLTSGTAVAFLAERVVMPQALSGSAFTMAFQIKIYHATNGVKDGAAYSTENITVSSASLASLVTTIPSWKMNTVYTYTIKIDPVGKTIKFDPAVAEWATDSGEKEVYSAN